MRKLGFTRFETAHNLAKKIRLMMSHYNDGLMAGQNCKADESFIVTSGSRRSDKRGRGIGQTMVHILASYEQKDPSGKKAGKALKNIKMDVLGSASFKDIKQVWGMHLSRNSKVTTDSFRSYKALKSQYPKMEQEIV